MNVFLSLYMYGLCIVLYIVKKERRLNRQTA